MTTSADVKSRTYHQLSDNAHFRRMPSYIVPDSDLEMGASLGNGSCWVTTLGTNAVQSAFHVWNGVALVGAISIRYTTRGHRLVHPGTDNHNPYESNPHDNATGFVSLQAEVPGAFEIHPAYQRHSFELPGGIEVRETVFVPKSRPPHLANGRLDCCTALSADLPVVYQMVELKNIGELSRHMRVYGYARLRGETPSDIQATFDPELSALVASNRSHPDWVRIFGASAPFNAYATTFDFARAYEPLLVFPLDNDLSATGDILGAVQIDLTLEAGQSSHFSFMTAFSPNGVDQARAIYAVASDNPRAILDETMETILEAVDSSDVLTPDPIINQGALWSKVNMLRVMAAYPQGPAFTNEPGVSSNVVGRDVAWFVYGNDHFLPDFSAAILEKLASVQYDNGKTVEYYNALTGQVDDYGLNINDDTPLFILAVNHHWRSSGDRAWLGRLYPAVVRAARYIIQQRDERGLVVCTARGENVWGICSWRNVIPNYSISGAVTELNAECAAALRSAGHLAQNLDRPDDEAQEFLTAAQAIADAMNTHLINPTNGLYYLTIDVDGNKRTDVTADEVFPVMFRVAPEPVAFRIISRLNSPDFWTEAGIRTASRNDLLYDPFRSVGLIGGVWPGMTWWYAFAAARYHPEWMVRALRASFAHYARDPQANNTVPGQFSEWFDGESLVNRGMRLSPWEPPRFLWAAVEGVCGVMVGPERVSIRPLVPQTWKWVALRRLPFHGQDISFFAAREDETGQTFQIYATTDVEADQPPRVYKEDISPLVRTHNQGAIHVALRDDQNVIVCIGNCSAQTIVVPVHIGDALVPATSYHVRYYNSEHRLWVDGATSCGTNLRDIAVFIEEGGFRLVSFTAV